MKLQTLIAGKKSTLIQASNFLIFFGINYRFQDHCISPTYGSSLFCIIQFVYFVLVAFCISSGSAYSEKSREIEAKIAEYEAKDEARKNCQSVCTDEKINCQLYQCDNCCWGDCYDCCDQCTQDWNDCYFNCCDNC